ncbi:MAG TPA: hypothetical protein VGC89_07425 [Pyrinomonadaceae bacterium]|jgi:hypothetical protein
MKIVHIDDEKAKLKSLAAKLDGIEPCSTPEALHRFLQHADAAPGIVVVDVGAFFKLKKSDMLSIGEDLADRHWRVVYWSTAVSANEVRDDCWFENENSPEGVAKIAAAIANQLQGNGLRRGKKRNHRELAIELLSSLLPFGLLWEASRQARDRAALEEAAQGFDLELLPAFEQSFARRFIEHLMGRAAPKWSVSKLHERDAFVLSGILSQSAFLKKYGEPDIEDGRGRELAGLDETLRSLATATTLPEWNERLTELRRALLA